MTGYIIPANMDDALAGLPRKGTLRMTPWDLGHLGEWYKVLWAYGIGSSFQVWRGVDNYEEAITIIAPEDGFPRGAMKGWAHTEQEFVVYDVEDYANMMELTARVLGAAHQDVLDEML